MDSTSWIIATDAGSYWGRRSEELPTRQWSDLLVRFGLGGELPGRQLAALAGYGALFAALAILGYRRDELRQFR